MQTHTHSSQIEVHQPPCELKLPSFAQLYLRLTYVITHFEQATITATKVFAPVKNKACFFHLSQSYWQRIQSVGLATQHGFNPEFNLKLHYLQALAFLPIEEMPTAFDNIKDQIPEEAHKVVQWFKYSYVNDGVSHTFFNETITR